MWDTRLLGPRNHPQQGIAAQQKPKAASKTASITDVCSAAEYVCCPEMVAAAAIQSVPFHSGMPNIMKSFCCTAQKASCSLAQAQISSDAAGSCCLS